MNKYIIITIVLLAAVASFFYPFLVHRKMGVILYTNSSPDLIKVFSPFLGDTVNKNFTITGEARGTWFFEASFPVQVLDKNGNVLFQTPAHADSDWMTENFVPFHVEVKIPDTYSGPAKLVLKKDNPSGMPEKDASLSIDIVIK